MVLQRHLQVQDSETADMSLNCQAIASTIGGIFVPNSNNVCDMLIPRYAPTITRPGNSHMNKFSTIQYKLRKVFQLNQKKICNGLGTIHSNKHQVLISP